MAVKMPPAGDSGSNPSSERAGTGFRSDPRKMQAEKSAPMKMRFQGRGDTSQAVFDRGEDGKVTFSSKGDDYLYSFDPATGQFTILASPDGKGVGAKIGSDHALAKDFQEAMGRAKSEAMPASPKVDEFPGFAAPNLTDLAESSPSDIERKMSTGFDAPRRFDLEPSAESQASYDAAMKAGMATPDPFADNEARAALQEEGRARVAAAEKANRDRVASSHRDRMLRFRQMREDAARKAIEQG